MTTASHHTTPESPATLAIQIQQLKDGVRNVVMFPKGTPVPGKARDIGMRDITTADGNRFWHNPAKISKSEIAAAVKKNELPRILGHDGYGAPDKSQLAPPVAAVVAETPQGVPAQDIATDKAHLKPALQAAERVKPPGGHIRVESPQQVINQREKALNPNIAVKEAMREITKKAAAGDIHAALKAGAQHTANGLLTDSQMEKALTLAGEPALKAGFAAIPDLHQAIKLFQGSEPAHQAILRPLLVARIHAMERRPKNEQMAVMSKLRENGLLSQNNAA